MAFPSTFVTIIGPPDRPAALADDRLDRRTPRKATPTAAAAAISPSITRRSSPGACRRWPSRRRPATPGARPRAGGARSSASNRNGSPRRITASASARSPSGQSPSRLDRHRVDRGRPAGGPTRRPGPATPRPRGPRRRPTHMCIRSQFVPGRGRGSSARPDRGPRVVDRGEDQGQVPRRPGEPARELARDLLDRRGRVLIRREPLRRSGS